MKSEVKQIEITRLRYDVPVEESDVIVMSVRILGFLPESDPLLVTESKSNPGKFDVYDGRKRLFGAQLRKDVNHLPCLLVDKKIARNSIRANNNRFVPLYKVINQRKSLCYYLIEVLNLVHAGESVQENLPLNKEHFALIIAITGFSLKSIQRGLFGLRTIFKNAYVTEKISEDFCLRDFFLSLIETDQFPKLSKFYRDEISVYDFSESFKVKPIIKNAKPLPPTPAEIMTHLEQDPQSLSTTQNKLDIFEKLLEISDVDSRIAYDEMVNLFKDFFSKNPNTMYWFILVARAIVTQFPGKFDKEAKQKTTYDLIDKLYPYSKKNSL